MYSGTIKGPNCTESLLPPQELKMEQWSKDNW